MGQPDQGARLAALLREWPGVDTRPHRFGGIEFRVDGREVGHFHPGGMLDLPVPLRMKRDLIAAGRAEAHRMLPNTRWVSFRVRTEHDLPAAITLLRLNYERLRGAPPPIASLPLTGHARLVIDTQDGDPPT